MQYLSWDQILLIWSDQPQTQNLDLQFSERNIDKFFVFSVFIISLLRSVYKEMFYTEGKNIRR